MQKRFSFESNRKANADARPCLQDFEWLQTVPFKSTTGRAAKRRESNEWYGLDFQYVRSRETIYVASNIPRKHVLLFYFRNTCGFPSSGYGDWSVQSSTLDWRLFSAAAVTLNGDYFAYRIFNITPTIQLSRQCNFISKRSCHLPNSLASII